MERTQRSPLLSIDALILDNGRDPLGDDRCRTAEARERRWQLNRLGAGESRTGFAWSRQRHVWISSERLATLSASNADAAGWAGSGLNRVFGSRHLPVGLRGAFRLDSWLV
jgi:hypothetical protein